MPASAFWASSISGIADAPAAIAMITAGTQNVVSSWAIGISGFFAVTWCRTRMTSRIAPATSGAKVISDRNGWVCSSEAPKNAEAQPSPASTIAHQSRGASGSAAGVSV